MAEPVAPNQPVAPGPRKVALTGAPKKTGPPATNGPPASTPMSITSTGGVKKVGIASPSKGPPTAANGGTYSNNTASGNTNQGTAGATQPGQGPAPNVPPRPAVKASFKKGPGVPGNNATARTRAITAQTTGSTQDYNPQDAPASSSNGEETTEYEQSYSNAPAEKQTEEIQQPLNSSGGSTSDGEPGIYVQKSFRATVNVAEIGSLRKGGNPPTGQSSANLINSSGSSSTLSNGTSSGQNLGAGGAEDFPTPQNAHRRIEEAFSSPIFTKVEITMKTGKRDPASLELLTTEQSYCKSLTIMNELYRLPLLEASKRGLLPISEDIVHNIFSRFFVDISRVNFVLCQGLVERFQNWSETQLLGDLLLDLLPFLKMYTMYSSNYEQCMTTLSEIEQKEPVQKFLAELNTNTQKTVDLRAYLIQPIQRIPRYRLLLEEIIKNTPPEHPDFANLHKALENIKTVAIQLDAAIYEHRNRTKMLEIQESFFGEKVQILEAGRVFIKEGELEKVCRKDIQKRNIWLFNDMFLIAQRIPPSVRFTKHRAFPLKQIRVKDLSDDGKLYKNAIQIGSEKKSFVLLLASHEEKLQWLSEFAKAITESEKTIRAAGDVAPTGLAPVWIPDSEAGRCMICGEKFTFTQRRHHCRQCGNVVCGKCSAKKKELPGRGKKRVCDSCYTKPYPDSASQLSTTQLSSSPSQAQLQPTHLGTDSPSSNASTSPAATSPGIPARAGVAKNPTMNNGTTPVSTSPAPTNTQPVQRSAPSPTPTPKTPGETFRAAYDYEPPVENPKKKLGFKAGDLLEVTIRNDPGWWFAIMGDQRGWVPASFLEPLDDSSASS